MDYTFEFVGVSPVLSFFNHQQEVRQRQTAGAEYLGSHRCTLDAFLEEVEQVPPDRGWKLDPVVDSVIHFWLHNADQVNHWKQRLHDAGSSNVLVARIADMHGLRSEFEFLFRLNG